jgi:TatA/E family protein of Tat protein translocase
MGIPCQGFFSGAIGGGEWLVLFVVVLILFGPRRLPHVARMMGRVMEQMRRASQDFRDQVMRIDETPSALGPGDSDAAPVEPDPLATRETGKHEANVPPAPDGNAGQTEERPDGLAG